MSKLVYDGELKNDNSNIKVRLILFYFIDEYKYHILYSPHLDLSGYGKNLSEAKESFNISLADFFDYTTKKKTLYKLLQKYGWKFKAAKKSPKDFKAPDITDLIVKNKHISEIINKYPVTTIHKDYNVPNFV